MSWSKVKLIMGREVRDQLRDRRTLFMIAVLPMLLYPLLGMSFFQITQFMREHPTQVLVLGAGELQELKELPPLIEDRRFADDLFEGDRANLLEVTLENYSAAGVGEPTPAERLRQARAALQRGDYQAVVYFPPDFASRLQRFHESLLTRDDSGAHIIAGAPDVPSPKIFVNSASEKSQLAYNRVSSVLERWTSAIGQKNLRDSKVPATAAWPFETKRDDVAAEGNHQDAAVWSKVLPFVLLIWALTGAFYPAIDLCAGEKERGTLETLLSSPAERSEIVWGKLLTIMLFSMATAALNLLSMGVTGAYLISQLKAMPLGGAGIHIGVPPTSAFVWLLLALVPMAALFSALCLALAAFARSTKEGQYYLMPLVLVMMPLMILPMAPGVELTLGNSLIPVTGVVLLLRTVLEGNYWYALPFVPPVVAVTLGCCLLSIRWAIDQFNRESVLFRESERLDLGLWVRHLVRDRGPTPTIAEAIACFVLIMIIQFFMNLAMQSSGSKNYVQIIFISQVVVIALPALLMTVMLTRLPRKTLLLDKFPPLLSVVVALLLAVAMHPIAHSLQFVVQALYPVSPEIIEMSQELGKVFSGLPIWLTLLLMAVLPALCEEVAFRGFILSGLRHTGHKWMAIALSAVFFGMAHSILQQSLMAALLGMLLGYIAIQGGSLLPCMVFHATHNSLMLLASHANLTPDTLANYPQLNWLVQITTEGDQTSHVYAWPLIIASAMVAGSLISYLYRLPYQKTAEESLQEALQHQSAHSLAS